MNLFVKQLSTTTTTTTMLTLLLWTARISWSCATSTSGMTTRGLRVNKCNRNPQLKQCQQSCGCECDEYWNVKSSTLCKDVCKKINNESPIDALPWCTNYNVIDACDGKFSDKWKGKWKNSMIEAVMDVTYMKAYGRNFTLNFFTDTNRSVDDELLPLALVIHGGGFNSGSKNNCKIIEDSLEVASRGYRTIAINYPMCGAYWSHVDKEFPVPEFGTVQGSGWYAWDADKPLYPPALGLQDEQCKWGGAHPGAHPDQYNQAAEVANLAGRYAMEFAHNKAQEWGIDVDSTICHGTSAGAITCYEMVLFDTTIRYRLNVSGIPSSIPELDDLKVDVAAGRAGALSFPMGRNVTQDTVDTMSPHAAVYNLHGVDDDVVPIEGARFFMNVLAEYDVPHYLNEVEGQGHSLEDWQFDVSHPERLNEMFAFIDDYLPPNKPLCDKISKKKECKNTDGCTYVTKPKKVGECWNRKQKNYPKYDCPVLSDNKGECLGLRNNKDKKMCKFKKVANPNLGCQKEKSKFFSKMNEIKK